jgi:hypothetical protein
MTQGVMDGKDDIGAIKEVFQHFNFKGVSKIVLETLIADTHYEYAKMLLIKFQRTPEHSVEVAVSEIMKWLKEIGQIESTSSIQETDELNF